MDDELEALVVEFLLAREAGADLSVDAFAADHPDREGELRGAIADALAVDELLPSEPSRPEAIGPYRVVRELGRGAMGVVFEVERDGHRAALKWFAGSLLLGPRGAERFARERALLQRLAHPGIARITDSGEHGGMPYLVMELIDGRTLAAAQPAASDAVPIVRALAEAVGAAHAAGVCHRDLKPSNVMLRSDGSPVLLDFGLGACADEATLTGTGDVLGTPRYMAPEQARGEVADARSDVFALGLMLFELVTGTPARASESQRRMLAEAEAGRTPRLPRTASVPRPLARIVAQATARRPAWRYADADALAADLGRFERGEAVLANPPGLALRGVDRVLQRPWVALGVVIVVAALAYGLTASGGVEESAAERAARLVGERQYEPAIGAYREALREGPETAELWAALARVYYRLARNAEGLEAVDRALAVGDRGDPSLRNLRGVLLDALGRHEDAQAVFVALCDEFTDENSYRFNLAHSLDAAGRVREARTRYEEVLARTPRHRDAKVSLAWLFATATGEFEDLRDAERATALCRELLGEGAGTDGRILATVVDIARMVQGNAVIADALAAAAADARLTDLQRRRLTDQARALRVR